MGRKALIESENVEKSARSVSHEHFFEIFKLLQQPTIKSRLCPLGKGFFCAQLPSLILILCNIFLNIQCNGCIKATSCSYRAHCSYIQNDVHLSLPASTSWVLSSSFFPCSSLFVSSYPISFFFYSSFSVSPVRNPELAASSRSICFDENSFITLFWVYYSVFESFQDNAAWE